MKTLHLSAHRLRRGFSLAELMVVIVIIGLLATMVVPNVLDRLMKAQGGVVKGELSAIKSALDQFAIENGGRYPDSLEALVTADENGHRFLDRETIPKDPWGMEYQYESPAYTGETKPAIYSLGKDNAPGGEGDNADIYWGAEKE